MRLVEKLAEITCYPTKCPLEDPLPEKHITVNVKELKFELFRVFPTKAPKYTGRETEVAPPIALPPSLQI